MRITDGIKLTKLHEPADGQMRVAGFMSGSGSNLRKILEHEKNLDNEREKSPYKIIVIFSDNPESKAEEIGKEYDIPVIMHDINEFCRVRSKPRKDLEIRPAYDNETANALSQYKCSVIACAGYMSLITWPILNNYTAINVHPADLSVLNEHSKRKYTGSKAVELAIRAGEKYIRATTHIMTEEVDGGPILMISKPLEVVLGNDFDLNSDEIVKRAAKENQERLKEAGDWIIFPKTLEYIADGRYSKNALGQLYFDSKRIQNGLILE